MIGFYVAATVVTLVQYLRTRDKRLLPLLAMFAFQAQSLGRDWLDVWKDIYQGLACAAGLVAVFLLTLPPHPARSGAHEAAKPVPSPPPERQDGC